MNDVVKRFRDKTDKFFKEINGASAREIEDFVKADAQAIIRNEYLDIEIVDVVLFGSRSRGLEHDDSDIDIVLEFRSETWKEDGLFNFLCEEKFNINGIPVDINPIREGETGTLEEYLPRAERYLEDKRKIKEIERSSDMERSVKDWYMARFPQDELAEEIKDDLRFNDVFRGLLAGVNIYKMIGSGDSLIRERIFTEIADTLSVNYADISDLWGGVNENRIYDQFCEQEQKIHKALNLLAKSYDGEVLFSEWAKEEIGVTDVDLTRFGFGDREDERGFTFKYLEKHEDYETVKEALPIRTLIAMNSTVWLYKITDEIIKGDDGDIIRKDGKEVFADAIDWYEGYLPTKDLIREYGKEEFKEQYKRGAKTFDLEGFLNEEIAATEKEAMKSTEKYICDAKYVSVWDGGEEIESACKVDMMTGEVFDIEPAEGMNDYVDIFEGEFVRFSDGQKFDVNDEFNAQGFWRDDTEGYLASDYDLRREYVNSMMIHGYGAFVAGDNVAFPVEFDDDFTPAQLARLKFVILADTNKTKKKGINERIKSAGEKVANKTAMPQKGNKEVGRE